MNEGRGWFRRFLLGAKTRAQSLARRSLSVFTITVPAKLPGEVQSDMAGIPAAGVAYPVNPANYDTANFICADAFAAEYDKSEDAVYLLDRMGARVPEKPLSVGYNVFLSRPLNEDYIGALVRGAEYGSDGLKQNIFLAINPSSGAGPSLVAHHYQPNPPDNSSMVYDPGDGSDDDASAGLHGAVWVMPWVKGFCSANPQHEMPGKTDVPLVDPPASLPEGWALALNGTMSGGDTTGWLTTRHANRMACYSQEAGGPLMPTEGVRHMLAKAKDPRDGTDWRINQGMLWCDAIWGRGDPKKQAPLEILDRDAPDYTVPEGFYVKARIVYDDDLMHVNHCGANRRGMRIVVVPLPITQQPPCTASRQVVKDSNGNPERSYPASQTVYSADLFNSPGLVFTPAPKAAQKPSHVVV